MLTNRSWLGRTRYNIYEGGYVIRRMQFSSLRAVYKLIPISTTVFVIGKNSFKYLTQNSKKKFICIGE